MEPTAPSVVTTVKDPLVKPPVTLVLKKWYSRKAKYGTSTTAHAALYNDEEKTFKLYCRQAGSYQERALVFVENPLPKHQCPECIDALAKAAK